MAKVKEITEEAGGMINGFKHFILRGNVLDLAVGIMIGAAFNGVVSALVRDLLTPLIAAIFGQPKFDSLAFTIHGSQFTYGDFLNSLVSFLITALAIYVFIVIPVNRLKGPPPPASTKQCPECLSKIPIGAKRCAFCAVELSTSL